MAKSETTKSSSSSGSNVMGQNLEDEAVVAFQEHWADALCRGPEGKAAWAEIVEVF